MQLSSESFVDSDTVLMTAAAVDDLIVSKNYLTSVQFSNIDAGAIQISSESFADSDTALMSAAAIDDRIESKNYITSVGFSNLNNEFKTVASSVTLSSGTATTALNFANHAVFPVVLPSDATNTSITFSSPTIGMTKVIKITGSGGTGTLTLPGTKLSGTLDQTNSTVNYVQVSVIGSSEYIYTISQAG